MSEQILTMMETLASYGTAPEEGCSLFGVGYEDTFHRLRTTYLKGRFSRGGSAEKYIVGPFGSGKTHFLHQFLEIARTDDCVTSKVTLNKDVDFTNSLIVFKEIVRQLRIPDGQDIGIQGLLFGCLDKIRNKAPSSEMAKRLVISWINGFSQKGFKYPTYGRVLQQTFLACLNNENEKFQSGCRWLSGEFEDRKLCELFDVIPMSKTESNITAKIAMYSLFQFIKHAGYQGTVVGFDEAEQGFAVEKKKAEKIKSMLMAAINATVELERGAVLFLYALTPDLIEQMDSFAALQQRISDPSPGEGFFDGNVYATLIDLTKRPEMLEDLTSIGRKLVDVMYEHLGSQMPTPKERLLEKVREIAEGVIEEDRSSSNRRSMVKRVSTVLLQQYDSAYQETAACWSEEEV